MIETIYKLQKYMITDEMIDNHFTKDSRLKLNDDDNLILIDDKNILFWLYFITKYDYSHYLGLERKKFFIQEKEKYSNIDIFNENTAIFKTHKLKKINVINNLLYENVNYQTLKALCIYNHLTIYLVYNNYYTELSFGSNKYIFYCVNNHSYYLKSYTEEELEKIKKEKIFIKNLDKKMNSVNYYKMDDLKHMAMKLNIQLFDDNKKKKKLVLYDEIKLKLNKL